MQCLHGQIILRELRQEDTVVYRVKGFSQVQKHGTHRAPSVQVCLDTFNQIAAGCVGGMVASKPELHGVQQIITI